VLDDTTADMTWALLMAAARRVTEAERWLRAGNWKGWKERPVLGVDVHHATLGIIGMGRIGQALARRAMGFSMRVLYHNRKRVPKAVEKQLGAKYVSMEKLLKESDFVSLNMPYSPESHHLIGARELGLMKPTAVIVNAARGGIIDDAALVHALKERRIAAAGLDVFEGEPEIQSGVPGGGQRRSCSTYRQRHARNAHGDGHAREQEPGCCAVGQASAQSAEPGKLAETAPLGRAVAACRSGAQPRSRPRPRT